MHSESIALSMHVHRLSTSTIFFKGYNCSMCEIDNEKVLHHHSHQFQVGKLQKRFVDEMLSWRIIYTMAYRLLC